jgi:hypothetical protein
MHHGLLVAKQGIAQSRILLQSLPNAGNISMSKNSQAAAKELMPVSISRGELGIQKGDRSLCRC